MKILRSWLQDYVEVKKSDNEVADLLTFSGTLVEGVETGLSEKVIVAKIIEINPHPNADKLRLVKVDTGKEILDIVCGAPNIEVGQHVPLATIGAVLSDFEIKEATIRGEKSVGMLCSEKELGIGHDHSGIKILSDEYKIGDPLNKYILSDAVFDLEITPNRGDCLSHVGIAHEYAALTDQKIDFKPEKIADKACNLEVEILNSDSCQRYFGILIKNVKIGPSPDWLKERLSKIGQSSINNVVDITNYIMLDLGQPLHAFDAKKLKGNKIIVRNAKEGEDITSIDGNVRKLEKDMLVIADEKNPIAIAGVMGGYDSEIDEQTTEIVLEAAEFERRSIRKTSKDLRLVTEASYRFERGIDPAMVELSGDKAANMILDICGGEIVGKVRDVADDYENSWVSLPFQKINDLLGTTISEQEINKILESLGFQFKDDMCQAPTWRHDILIWEDLSEEIARIYGFSNIKYIPVTKTEAPLKGSYYIKEKIKDVLVESGFTEIYGYAFLSEQDLSAINLDPKDLLEIANPVQSENKYMRKSLLPGLLRTLAKNPAFDPILIFEIGNVFAKDSEDAHLAIVASGKQCKRMIEGAISSIKNTFGISIELNTSELSRDDLARFKIKKPITYAFEISIKDLFSSAKIDQDVLKLSEAKKTPHYRPISKYPSITRDLAFIVSNETNSEDILELMYKESDLINRVELFDEFSSDKFGAGKKNIAFHLDLQHQDRTLTDNEVDAVTKSITTKIETQFGAKLRTS